MASAALYFWGQDEQTERTVRSCLPAQTKIGHLPAGPHGLQRIVGQGGGVVLVPPQDEGGRKWIKDMLRLSRVVVIEIGRATDPPGIVAAENGFRHVLIPMRAAREALPAILPLAQELTRKWGTSGLGVDEENYFSRMVQIASTFRVATDEQELYERFTEAICRHLPFRRAMFFTRENGHVFRLRAISWPGGEPHQLAEVLRAEPPKAAPGSPEYESFFMGRAVPVSAELSSFFPLRARRFFSHGGEIALAPVFSDQEFVGVVSADHAGAGKGSISEGELTLLETFVAMVGSMLHNFWLYRELEAKNQALELEVRKLTLVSEITRVLNQGGAPEESSARILAAVCRTLEADFAFLLAYDEQAAQLKLLGSSGMPAEAIEHWQTIEGITPHALEEAVAEVCSAEGCGSGLANRLLPETPGPVLIRVLRSRGEITGLWGMGRNEGREEFERETLGEVLVIVDEQMSVALSSFRLRHLASVDSLTGLYTRRHFMEALEQELKLGHYLSYPVALVMVDADHFKRINDTFGHPAGDKVLMALGEALRNNTRSSDVCARLGGEEFAVLLPRCNEAGAVALAEKIRSYIEQLTTEYAGNTIPITVSMGVAVADGQEKISADELIRRADEALYQAKATGRNRVSVWKPSE